MPYKYEEELNHEDIDLLGVQDLSEEEKQNEIDIVEIQQRYLNDGDDDYKLKEKRFHSFFSPGIDKSALGITDPGTPKERKKLYKKIADEYRQAKKRLEKSNRENRIRYYKIYFLGNLGQADVEFINTDNVHIRGNHVRIGESYTIVKSPETGIGMKEAEKYLLDFDWDLKKAYNQICLDKGIKNEYDKINYIGNVNTQFNSFFKRFDNKTRNDINKFALIAGGIILLILVLVSLNANNPIFNGLH